MSPEAVDPPDVEHVPDARRFEVHAEGKTAFLSYRRDGDRLVLIHTEVPESLRDRGIGGRLARFALDYAKREGLGVVPRCPFVKTYIQEHPEYLPLVPGSAR